MTISPAATRAVLYRTLWRWHFYAGLLVIPFILFLSLTGAIYLFKPQLDRWQEAGWHGLAQSPAVSADAQLAAALRAVPGARFHHYRLPSAPGDAAVVHVALPNDAGMRDVAVAPDGRVITIVDPETRISAVVARLHGSLLLGTPGSLIVETAASWAIVLILSGLYLWWPRGRGAAGVVWPRLDRGGRLMWRDLHAVTGFWVAGLALITLASGLPWTEGWATGFKLVRAELGWVKAPQDWRGGIDLHAAHDHAAMARRQPARPAARDAGMPIDAIVARAQREPMPFPAILSPPGAPARFGKSNGAFWKLTSEAQNRPLIRTVRFDAATGDVVGRQGFADKHVIDRVINYGIAWHEGQLFGWINQAIGLLTAGMLMLLAVSGTIMWWRKRPSGRLGAPPIPSGERSTVVVAMIAVMAALLPMLTVSLVIVWLLDRLVAITAPSAARWLERA
ncbi:MAG: PepSY domain-containing protein [Sphingomonas sp.]|nr:PepSY domain-containing protein [Sphingomonas sp.]